MIKSFYLCIALLASMHVSYAATDGTAVSINDSINDSCIVQCDSMPCDSAAVNCADGTDCTEDNDMSRTIWYMILGSAVAMLVMLAIWSMTKIKRIQ